MKKETKYRQPLYLSSCQKERFSPETSALHRLAEPPHSRPPTLMNKLCIHEHMSTPYEKHFHKNVHWCRQTPVIAYSLAHALVLKAPVQCMPRPPQKMHMHLRMHAYPTVQPQRCHQYYCELSENLKKLRSDCRQTKNQVEP